MPVTGTGFFPDAISLAGKKLFFYRQPAIFHRFFVSPHQPDLFQRTTVPLIRWSNRHPLFIAIACSFGFALRVLPCSYCVFGATGFLVYPDANHSPSCTCICFPFNANGQWTQTAIPAKQYWEKRKVFFNNGSGTWFIVQYFLNNERMVSH